MLMLKHYLSTRTAEHWVTSHSLPERRTQRVKIRTDVNGDARKLLWAGKLRCSGKMAVHRNRGLRTCFGGRFGKAEVNDFSGHRAAFLKAHHDITRFDVAMNQLLLVDCRQASGDLRRN